MTDYFTHFSCLLDVGTPDNAARALDGASCVGHPAIASELAKLLKAPGVMTSRNNFCVVHGDFALLRADWTLAEEGGSVLASGSSAEVVRRQSDGRWLYMIDHATGAGLTRVGD